MEEVVAYDEAHLVERLDTLAPHFRVAFAAACAERQFLGYLANYLKVALGFPDGPYRLPLEGYALKMHALPDIFYYVLYL